MLSSVGFDCSGNLFLETLFGLKILKFPEFLGTLT